jgi:ribA/ribD-fused uncharacterized protein
MSESNFISFTKVRGPYGWMGNMAPINIIYDGKEWFHTEGLFQALRFKSDSPIREEIRAIKNPITAKFFSRNKKSEMSVVMMSEEDIDNMRLCVKLKFEQHPELKAQLIDTGNKHIYEDVTNRQGGSGLFWGAAFNNKAWDGKNWLGKILMEYRNSSL